MKFSFQIGNDPMTYTIETDVEYPPSKDLRTPKEIFRQEVQNQ